MAAISDAQPDPGYRQCYPDSIVKVVAEVALEGVKGIGCGVAAANAVPRIDGIMNEAWGVFRRDPVSYSSWEGNHTTIKRGATMSGCLASRPAAARGIGDLRVIREQAPHRLKSTVRRIRATDAQNRLGLLVCISS